MDKESQTVVGNKELLHYKIEGEGYPVVFLHGFLESNHIWEDILPGLPNRKKICIELPGHGNSEWLGKEISLPSIARKVRKVIKHFNISHFSIVGHSMGGYVALYLTEFTDLKIDHLVLLHSHPFADSQEKKINRKRAARAVEYNKIRFIREVIPNLYYDTTKNKVFIEKSLSIAGQISKECIIQFLHAMKDREDKVSVLKNRGRNLHILQGEFDPLIPFQEIKDAAMLNNNNFHIIKNVGHNGYKENPKAIISALHFLQT